MEDLREDTLGIFYKESDGILEEFLKYKYLDVKLNIDIDVSKRAVEFYKDNYDFLKNYDVDTQNGNKYELKKDDTIYRGDVMTSPWNLVKYALQLTDDYEVKINKIIDESGKSGSLINYIPEFLNNIEDFTWTEGMRKIRKESINAEKYIINRLESYLNSSEDSNKFFKLLENFIFNAYTPGNLIPVPLGFNTGRGGDYAKFDYWDITMVAIYGWYNDNPNKNEKENKVDYNINCKDKWLEKLLKVGSKVKNCKKWLDNFVDWKNFVEENKLEAFTTKDKQGNIYPKRIIDGKVIFEKDDNKRINYSTFFGGNIDDIENKNENNKNNEGKNNEDNNKKDDITYEDFKPHGAFNSKNYPELEKHDIVEDHLKPLINYLINLNIAIEERNRAFNWTGC